MAVTPPGGHALAGRGRWMDRRPPGAGRLAPAARPTTRVTGQETAGSWRYKGGAFGPAKGQAARRGSSKAGAHLFQDGTWDYDRRLMAALAHAAAHYTRLTRTGSSMEMTDAQAGRGAPRPRGRPSSLGSRVQPQSSHCSYRVCGALDMSVKVWRRVDQPRGWPQVCGHARGQGHGQQGPHSGRSFPGSSPANAPVVRGESSHCSCLRFTFSPAPF